MIRLSTRARSVGTRLLKEAKVLIPLWIFILACLVPKQGKGTENERYEFFPFSHFPMYSGFSERDYYVYVSDRDGEPLATETLAFVRSTKLKKIFNTELSGIQKRYKKRKDLLTGDQCRPAGDATLKWLVENAPDSAGSRLRDRSPLRLYRVYISVDRGTLVETDPQEVGQWPSGETVAP